MSLLSILFSSPRSIGVPCFVIIVPLFNLWIVKLIQKQPLHLLAASDVNTTRVSEHGVPLCYSSFLLFLKSPKTSCVHDLFPSRPHLTLLPRPCRWRLMVAQGAAMKETLCTCERGVTSHPHHGDTEARASPVLGYACTADWVGYRPRYLVNLEMLTCS